MAFDRDDIEKVKQSTNIVELVEAVTTVRKRGRSFKAICPFHQEKTPSMSLDPARGLYHCFGCNAGGDVVQFVMETQALDFSEAVEALAKRAGVTLRIDPEAAKRRGQRQRLIDAVEAAVAFYVARLKQGADAGTARSYLRGRGYGVDVVDQFEIGYAPQERGRMALVHHLKDKGFSERQLVDAGLARRGSRGGLIDWFGGRVMFPIRDLKGDAVGFGARLLEGEGPKYLNTPETRLYRKAELLYGLDRAKAEITRRGFSIVVEGYTDVIALHRAGMPVAVASCGTALGEDHFDLLRRFSERIVLAFDADQAGAGAAIRGDELHLPAELGLDLRVAKMPAGRDPADLVQDGDTEQLLAAIDASAPLLQFRLERLVERHRLDEPEGRARAVREAAALVGRLSDRVARSEYARFITRLTGADASAVAESVEQAARGRRTAPQTEPTTHAAAPTFPPPRTGAEKVERETLRLAMAGRLAGRTVPADWFGRADYRSVYELIVEPAAVGPVDHGSISDEHVAAFLRTIILDTSPEADADELLARLELLALDRSISDLRSRLEHTDPAEQTHSQLLSELIALERTKRDKQLE